MQQAERGWPKEGAKHKLASTDRGLTRAERTAKHFAGKINADLRAMR